MVDKYGFSLRERERAKEEIIQILIDHAKDEKLISYSELCSQVKTIELKPHSNAMAAVLEEISIAEDEAGRGLLTVIVVRKNTGSPGAGFFKLAKSRNKDIAKKNDFWIKESKRVFEQWKE